MLKIYNPANIPTFYDGENMEEVRTKTINPLTEEVTNLGKGIQSVETTISNHGSRITNLEMNGGGGGGSVDLTPVYTRLTKAEQEVENLDIRTDILETGKLELQVAVGGLNTRVTSLENSGGTGGGGASTFTGLSDTPSTLVANGYVKVNAAGNALEYKDEKFLTDQSYINDINVYGDYTLGTGGSFSEEQVANSGVAVVSSTSPVAVQMPVIVEKTSMPTSSQVRSGRSISVISLTASIVIKAPVGGVQKLWVDGAAKDEYILEAGETITFYALHNGTKFTHYVVTSGRKVTPQP